MKGCNRVSDLGLKVKSQDTMSPLLNLRNPKLLRINQARTNSLEKLMHFLAIPA